MDRFLRLALVVVGLVSLILALGFSLQLNWATRFWPWPDTPLSYIFLGSIFAAAGTGVLWIGLSGEFAAATGGAINFTIAYIGIALSLFLFYQQKGDPYLLTCTVACVAGAVISAGIFLWFRRYGLRDNQPLPVPVRISFGLFIVMLVFFGVALILQVPNVFPWKLSGQSSVLFGWIFVGSACTFVPALIRPMWHFACGQLIGFLAYDLVLIVPFLLHLSNVIPEQRISLTVYILVLVYSGALAIYYLFLNAQTRLWRISSGQRKGFELN